MNARKSSRRLSREWPVIPPAVCLLCISAVWLWGAIKPLYRQDWLVENLPVFVAVPILVGTYRRFRFSNLSYALMTVFLLLHLFGAHYTYSEVPFGNWLRDHWHLTRNHYDRIVHFAFGFLIAFPIWEIFGRQSHLKRNASYLIAIHVVLAWSGLYEVIEAVVASLVNPRLGAAYNGIQGDVWDAQKDMGLAFGGAIICMAFTAISSTQTSLRQTFKRLNHERLDQL